ncbi:MAG: hypothetical protein QW369_05005 [Desulfurococcaceae archaeon]
MLSITYLVNGLSNLLIPLGIGVYLLTVSEFSTSYNVLHYISFK